MQVIIRVKERAVRIENSDACVCQCVHAGVYACACERKLLLMERLGKRSLRRWHLRKDLMEEGSCEVTATTGRRKHNGNWREPSSRQRAKQAPQWW